MILPPRSEISHHQKVTNMTMSPTSLLPFFSSYYWLIDSESEFQTIKLICSRFLIWKCDSESGCLMSIHFQCFILLKTPYWLICWFYIATDMLSLFYWKEVISFDTIKCNLFIPKLNCLATRKNGFGIISWMFCQFTIYCTLECTMQWTIEKIRLSAMCAKIFILGSDGIGQ